MKLSDIKADILIIDDDADIRDAVRLTLESEPGVDYSFTEADSVASGMEALKATNSNVVILDLHMPGEDGFVFMDRLKTDKSLPLSRVIVLTADNTSKNLWATVNKGVNAYQFIGKPFVSEELRALVLRLAWPEQN